MLFLNTLCILVAAALSNATSLSKRVLAFDDILVLGGDGSAIVMKEAEYSQLQARGDLLVHAASQTFHSRTQPRSVRKNPPSRRRCEKSKELQILSDESFLGGDVAMSPVVNAAVTNSDVSVQRGYSLSNALSEEWSAGYDSVFETSFDIQNQQTWETDGSTSFSFTVPEGQYGLIISQPYTRRIQGNYLSGCTDSFEKKSFFVSTSYKNQTYSGLDWVEGVIRLCNSTYYPVPYCAGNGTHY